MKPSTDTSDNFTYETVELKLAALLVSKMPEATFTIYKNPNSLRKTIAITFPKKYKDKIVNLERDFINKEAEANVYSYNRALNMIRDRLRESDERKMGNDRSFL